MRRSPHQSRRSVAKTITFLEWMIGNKKAVPADIAEDVHDDLALALTALEKAFGIDAD